MGNRSTHPTFGRGLTSPDGLIFTDARGVLHEVKYAPDQPRDDHGRFGEVEHPTPAEYDVLLRKFQGEHVFPSDNPALLKAKVTATVDVFDKAVSYDPSWSGASGELKNEVVTKLAAATGMPYDRANQMIKTWSHSSTDTEPDSIALQTAAAKRFGVDPGAYIKEKADYMAGGYRAALEAGPPPARTAETPFTTGILEGAPAMHALNDAIEMSQKMDPTTSFVVPKEYFAPRNGNADHLPFPGYGEHIYMESDGWVQQPLEDGSVRFTHDNATNGVDNIGAPNGSITWHDRMDDASRTVGAIYANTQQVLAEAGVKEVTVFRGMNWNGDPNLGFAERDAAEVADPSRGMPKDLWAMREGDVEDVTVKLNPLSSFSVNVDTAWKFGDGDRGRIFGVTVPASRVFSFPSTGPGSLSEGEVILTGGPTDLHGGQAQSREYLAAKGLPMEASWPPMSASTIPSPMRDPNPNGLPQSRYWP